jgi:cystathionine gamma-lyase
MTSQIKDSTRAARLALTPARAGDAVHAGPVFVSTFHSPGDPVATEYSYGRSHQPTWTALERAIGELEVDAGNEPAGVRVFASGLSAVAAAFGAVLRAGEHVVVQAGCYFGVKQLLQELLAPSGVSVRIASGEELASPKTLAGARMVWLETPGNPELDIADVRAVVAAARQAGALVAVDNTTATPLGQRPLELGADLSVCSDSKAMCGHSDVLLGHVAVRDSELLQKIDRYRELTGGIAGPMEAWLALRSLATLPLRLERMSASALKVAEFLRSRDEVEHVLYPGLPTHLGHAVAAGQMRSFGPVLSFTLAGKQAAERFLSSAELITEATSFGGVTTTAERRARWGHDGVAPGFIRMSVGLEDAGDLIADMEQALDGLGGAVR